MENLIVNANAPVGGGWMRKIQAINHNTRYDITAKLRRLVRRLESGEFAATDVVVVTREFTQPNASPRVELHHYGTASHEEIHWMLSTAKNRVEPA
jgi:hypothetical protein